jgi:hypothetical protein
MRPPDATAELQELLNAGWEPAPDGALWVALPDVWPEHARKLVADGLTRYVRTSRDGGPWQDVPWTAEDYEDWLNDTNNDRLRLGLPPHVEGTLWLLRAPNGHPSLQSALDVLATGAAQSGVEVGANAEFLAFLRGRVGLLFEGP